ncbi:hypothetical protein ACPPVO_35140 [Dactylosporangium sp. McL0621]|uniref:hypothetical protein n=1 Tax=Dactylosporangium sp. McL0621 TaxID=3415678 RepID=UPI003CEDEB6E
MALAGLPSRADLAGQAPNFGRQRVGRSGEPVPPGAGVSALPSVPLREVAR